MDMPDIPDFLRVTAETPRAAWTPPKKKRSARAKRHPFHLPVNIEPAGLALLKEIEREKKQKMVARFAALRERKR